MNSFSAEALFSSPVVCVHAFACENCTRDQCVMEASDTACDCTHDQYCWKHLIQHVIVPMISTVGSI